MSRSLEFFLGEWSSNDSKMYCFLSFLFLNFIASFHRSDPSRVEYFTESRDRHRHRRQTLGFSTALSSGLYAEHIRRRIRGRNTRIHIVIPLLSRRRRSDTALSVLRKRVTFSIELHFIRQEEGEGKATI